jgi:hypothetical protein
MEVWKPLPKTNFRTVLELIPPHESTLFISFSDILKQCPFKKPTLSYYLKKLLTTQKILCVKQHKCKYYQRCDNPVLQEQLLAELKTIEPDDNETVI